MGVVGLRYGVLEAAGGLIAVEGGGDVLGAVVASVVLLLDDVGDVAIGDAFGALSSLGKSGLGLEAFVASCLESLPTLLS